MSQDTHIVDSDPQVTLEAYEQPPENACVRWERCGNEIPGGSGRMCGPCLDEVRRNDSNYDRF